MIYANQAGVRIRASKGAVANCPSCGADVIAKCGDIKIDHWAHRSIRDCDSWSEGETPWHLGWKELFPFEQREVVIGPHRADVKTADGVVIEFQHSPISSEEIAEREVFYGRMVWVFDASVFEERLMLSEFGGKTFFSWKNAVRRSHLFVSRPMVWDFGNGNLLLVERLTAGGGYGQRLTVAELRSLSLPNRKVACLAWRTDIDSFLDPRKLPFWPAGTTQMVLLTSYLNKVVEAYERISPDLDGYKIAACSIVFYRSKVRARGPIFGNCPVVHVVSYKDLMREQLLPYLAPDLVIEHDEVGDSISVVASK